jgi:hypothetical protein
MGISIRQMSEEIKLCHQIDLEMLTNLFPKQVVMDILEDEGVDTQRERRLNLVAMVYLLIGAGLFAHLSLQVVWRQLTHGIRLICMRKQESRVPVPSAFTYRRKQVGYLPLEALMRRCCRPLADERTPEAFRFGLRLMALDSTIEAVADTPAFDCAFGRLAGRKGKSAFPQLQATYLLECGTHAIIDAQFLPCRVNERHAARILMRSLTPAMLLQWDTGFHDFDLFRRVRRTGAHVLGRLPAGPSPHKIKHLSDGSWLVDIQPGHIKRRRAGEKQRLRLIEYTLTDERLPHAGKKHRLLTSLLDEVQAPAIEVVCCYHERWEVEVSIDELDTHQRALTPQLRSQRVELVYQELHGLVLAHYLIRAIMLQSAAPVGLDPDRLSFTHAVQIIRAYIPTLQMLAPEDWAPIQERMHQEIREERLPERRLRINARVVKRKYSPFDLKRPKHAHPPRFAPDEHFQDFILLI